MARASTLDAHVNIIGHLGPEGSHSEEALLTLQSSHSAIFGEQWGRHQAELSLRDLLQKLGQGELNAIFVPIENATEGTVREVMDALSFDFESACIQLEWVHPITHSLIRKTADPAGITTIMSHPQALAQSRETLKTLYPDAELVPTSSTSQAVVNLLSAQEGVAALGSPSAASTYGLHVITENTCDNPWNTTRFVLLSLQDDAFSFRTEANTPLKTSLCLGPQQNAPGALARIINVIADYGLDMTQIVSRPAKKHLGDYIFYVDFMGTAPPAFYTALEAECGFVKRLGVYPSLAHPHLDTRLKQACEAIVSPHPQV